MNLFFLIQFLNVFLLSSSQGNNCMQSHKDVIRIEFATKAERTKLEGVFSIGFSINQDANLLIISIDRKDSVIKVTSSSRDASLHVENLVMALKYKMVLSEKNAVRGKADVYMPAQSSLSTTAPLLIQWTNKGITLYNEDYEKKLFLSPTKNGRYKLVLR